MAKPDSLIQGELIPERFNALLSGPLSTRIGYAQADLCPCRAQRSSGNPDPKCPRCGGLGYTWQDVVPGVTSQQRLTRAPLPGFEARERLPDPRATIAAIEDEHGVQYDPAQVEVQPDGTVRWLSGAPADYTLYTVTMHSGALRAGVQGVMARREYQVRGEYDVLDLEMTLDRRMPDNETLNPAWDCGEADRFWLIDMWRRHAQHVLRGPGGDRTVYRHMKDLKVSSLIGTVYTVYQPGEDYTFADGLITWQAGKGPPLGTTYAVQGQANPEYYVFKALPQLRHQNGIPLPRRIVLKSFEQFPNRRAAAPVS